MGTLHLAPRLLSFPLISPSVKWSMVVEKTSMGRIWVVDDQPDLMILDVMMPGLDGFAVLQAVRGDPRTAKLPVIMFSAVSDPSRIAHAMARGANDYWIKASFDFSELEAKINEHIA